MARGPETGETGRGLVGPGLEPASLVDLAHQLRDLGVRRFEYQGATIEFSEAAIALSFDRELAKKAAEYAPKEATQIEREREEKRRQADSELTDLELLSA